MTCDAEFGMPVELYWNMPTREAADALAADLQRAGHVITTVRLRSPAWDDDPFPWFVESLTGPEAWDDFAPFEELADRHGGELDGGATYVQLQP